MDKTTKGIAVGVAVGIVVAVLIISVIIPAIRQASLRHQINQQAERREAVDELTCRIRMRTLAVVQERFKAEGDRWGNHNDYAISLDELLNSSDIEGVYLIECPSGYGDEYYFDYNHRDKVYTITCPNGHGSITNGECSWVQE